MDGRYGLKELLGSGGMAEVYLAYDVVLDRAVALKMMHGRYAAGAAAGSDPSIGQELRREVVERFRREARAAGSLSHPSIVAVYDQGSCEDGTPYIAMEYVPGGTLKDGIRRYGAIPPRAAAETALQIANALAAAHDQGMVHRDIKPHNILITASGDVKVTDFGIARAAAVPPEAAVGEPVGKPAGETSPGRSGTDASAKGGALGGANGAVGSDLTATGIVMGTAGYISPEQALGEPAGPQSDLYSLGVTLYEMLTGELPFRAETQLATAVKHVAEPPRPAREVNPAVPPEIDAVTRRLLEKDPSRRYADAGALAADLQRILDEPALPQAASGTAPPRADGARYPSARGGRGRRRDSWRTRRLLVVSLVPVLGAALLAAYAWANAPAGVAGAGEGARGPFGQIGEVLEGVPGPVGGTKAPSKPGAKPKSEPPKSGPPVELRVPDLVGMPLGEAREDGSPAEGLEVVEEGRIASEEPAGVILKQRPAPSQDPDSEDPKVKKGSEISVVVSEKRPAEVPGAVPDTVPDVVGGSRDAAGRALETAGFEARFRESESGAEEEGRVVDQNPAADARAEAGSPVTVTVGTGPAEIETPDVRGATVEAARAELEEAGLLLGGTERRPSEEARAGDVYAQDPAAGVAAEPGAAVDVSVSTGPAEVAVPDVLGLDLDSAKQAVLDAGLGYTAVGTAGGFGEAAWSVLSTDPPAGTTLEPEAYVEIVYVAEPAEATTSASPSSSASPPASPPASAPASPPETSAPETRPSRPSDGSGGSPGTPPITSDDGGRGLDREDERRRTEDRRPKRAGSDTRR